MDITFNTAHGKFGLDIPNYNITLIELCKFNNLPFQSICFYKKNNKNELEIIKDVYTHTINDLKDNNIVEIILQPNRNINFSKILNKDILIQNINENFSSEYTFQSSNFQEIVNVEFNPDECFRYIYKCTNDFFNSIDIDDRKIVIGISGGGDSNTLLKALINCDKIDKNQIIAVMCTGLNVWDSAKERAKYICNEAGVELKFVESREICDIIGKRRSENWDEAFFEVFEDSDIDALGTLIVRKVLQHYVEKHNAQAMVTGLNLEDLLAESFFQITKKKLPLPFPIRTIDNIPLWFPLFEVPKKILDGCYPKFSLENYEQRNADKLINRAVPYYFSQMTSSILPGYEFDLLNGFKELSKLNTSPFHYDEKLGFEVTEPVSEELIGKWKYFTIC
ncbi:ATP-binding protein [Abyssalbus ytuae]|uniref:Uncharacterized protein n=1 Tax=Abyssalbus ytuae TaxID=2926907 RepID=A0A9E7D0Y6_9FLAO|nr:ATP-binding protein [Abyssalbus ytuae]UOB16508.1 hypothetical protein MQE35_12260 [Abyssalbus ytuae]